MGHMAMQLPTVTIDDLRAFHAKHFPNVSIPANFLHGVTQSPEEVHHEYEEEDDDLGYYPDGAKRTLTDEQIALFRHTEIQTILRERRHKREAAAETLEPEIEHAHPQVPDFSFGAATMHATGKADAEMKEGEVVVVSQEASATGTPKPAAGPRVGENSASGDAVLHGRVETPPQWRKRSKQATQQKNARSRKAHRKKRKDERKNRREGRGGSIVSGATGDNDGSETGESDEWDPWHQAKGPDALVGTNVELEY